MVIENANKLAKSHQNVYSNLTRNRQIVIRNCITSNKFDIVLRAFQCTMQKWFAFSLGGDGGMGINREQCVHSYSSACNVCLSPVIDINLSCNWNSSVT